MGRPASRVAELKFRNGATATRVHARPGEEPKCLIAQLGLGPGSRPVIVVCGGAGGFGNGSPTPDGAVLGRAIAHSAARSGASVIDGGTESGVMSIVGNARSEDPLAMPVLVGVAPRGKVSEPGDAHGSGTPLEPNHSHFILAHGDEWGSETPLLFGLAAALAAGDQVVVVLAGGGDNARREVQEAIERRWPLIVADGFGGLADEIAVAAAGGWRQRRRSASDVRDVAKYQLLGVVGGEPERLADWLVWELADRPVLRHAWDVFAAFDTRANRLQSTFFRLQQLIIGLGIVVTALAVVHALVAGAGEDVVHWPTLVLPSIVALLIAWSGRRAFGKRWILLRAAAEAVKAETFRYRTGTGPYRPPADPERVLHGRLGVIKRQLSGTEAVSGPLARPSGPGPPARIAIESVRDLTPMSYVQRRLLDQLSFYHARVGAKNRDRNILQLVTLGMGGTGTVLAAAGLDPWVAITAAVSAGSVSYLTTRQHEQDILVYNEAAADLEATHLEWLAAGGNRTDPNVVERLVRSTEDILTEEVGGWARRMARALEEQGQRQRDAAQAVAELRRESTP